MAYKEGDFVRVELDIYANDKLVQTSDEKKGKEAGLQIEEYKAQPIVLGKGFVLKALDDDILKGKDKNTLELEAKDAYGPRKKDLLHTFPKSAFDEHKMRPVVGVTYDFNGMYGVVKSVVGGRILVDFNNPLAGKNVRVEYSIKEEIKDIKEKIEIILKAILRIPKDMVQVDAKDKNVTLKVPAQLNPLQEQLKQTLEEYINDMKEYTLKFEELVIKK